MTDNHDDIETHEQIHSGVSITAKLKRGSGTRDQDEIKLKAKGRDADEAAAQMAALVERAEAWADDLRAVQPDSGGDE